MSSSAFARVPFCSAASSAPGAKGGEVLTGAFSYAAASKNLLFDGLKGKRHHSVDNHTLTNPPDNLDLNDTCCYAWDVTAKDRSVRRLLFID